MNATWARPSSDARANHQSTSNHTSNHTSSRRRSIAAIAAAATALTAAIAVATAPSPVSAASGTVTVTAFEDLNWNATRDTAGGNLATEPGIAGATVTVTDGAGGSFTGVTDANGVASIAVTGTPTQNLRVEVVPPAPYRSGPIGAGSGGTLQFVTLSAAVGGTATASLGLTREGLYASSDNPYMIVPTNRAMFDEAGRPIPTHDAMPALYGFPYDSSGRASDPLYPATAGLPTVLATQGQIQTTWGTANYRTNWALSAAAFRRASPVGPGGLGAIYITDIAQAQGGTPNATPFVTIPNTGTSPRPSEDPGYDWLHDPQGIAGPGRIGLGDIDITNDMTKLFAVNLTDRNLYEVALTPGATAAAAPAPGAPTAIALPLNLPGATRSCANANVQPFGLGEHLGVLYVTLTCTGPTTADLTGYVYSMDETTHAFSASPVIETPLNYARGDLNDTDSLPNPAATPGEWGPWSDTINVNTLPNGTGITQPPQPLLSTITFDAAGNASLSIRNRNAMQGAWAILAPGTNQIQYTFGADEMLKYCGTPGAWTLESNGTCGASTGQSGLGYGPGGGFFYDADFTIHPDPQHHQAILGSAVQIPGFSNIMSVSFDPQPGYEPHYVLPDGTTNRYFLGVEQNGFRVFPNDGAAAGDVERWGVLDTKQNPDASPNQTGNFGKGGGLGDLSAMLDLAPVEIGNRVWIDADRDGEQDAVDANEVPRAGVTVNLYDATGTTLIATAVTDTNGNYLFSAAAGATTPSTIHGLDLTAGTDYVIRLDNPADYQPGGQLYGYSLTTPTAVPDTTVDSNGLPYPIPASTVTGATANVTTPEIGAADHTFDFGFVPGLSLGNRLWYDEGVSAAATNNGVFDPGEQQVVGATVELLNNVGAVIATTTTDANGYYLFIDLAPGDYQVRIPGSNFVAGGPLDGYLSSSGTTGGTFTLVDNNEDHGVDNPTPTSGGITSNVVQLTATGNPTGDAGGTNDTNAQHGPTGDVYDNLTVDFSFVQPYDLMITKSLTSSEPYALGSPVTYNLVVTNNGPGVAFSGFTVTDNLPVGLVFGTPAAAGTNWICDAPVGQEVSCTWTGADLDDDESTSANPITINAVVDTADSATLVNFSVVRPSPSQPMPETIPVGTTNGGYENGSNIPTTANPSNNDDSQPINVSPPVVAVGDYTWIDTNNNGVQDAGETPIAGIIVTLLTPEGTQATDADGFPVPPVVTDANGHYVIDNLLPGEYIVHFSLPPGYSFTVQNGGTSANDSNPSITSGQTPVFTIGAGTGGDTRPVEPTDLTTRAQFINPTIDAGYVLVPVPTTTTTTTTTTPPIVAPPTTVRRDLPSTGSNSGSTVWWALALLGIGATTLIVARRRGARP